MRETKRLPPQTREPVNDEPDWPAHKLPDEAPEILNRIQRLPSNESHEDNDNIRYHPGDWVQITYPADRRAAEKELETKAPFVVARVTRKTAYVVSRKYKDLVPGIPIRITEEEGLYGPHEVKSFAVSLHDIAPHLKLEKK